MKLYKVHTKSYDAYVVATDPSMAEKILVEWLDEKDYGFQSDRVVLKIDLLADTKGSPRSVVNPAELLLGKIKEE